MNQLTDLCLLGLMDVLPVHIKSKLLEYQDEYDSIYSLLDIPKLTTGTFLSGTLLPHYCDLGVPVQQSVVQHIWENWSSLKVHPDVTSGVGRWEVAFVLMLTDKKTCRWRWCLFGGSSMNKQCTHCTSMYYKIGTTSAATSDTSFCFAVTHSNPLNWELIPSAANLCDGLSILLSGITQ